MAEKLIGIEKKGGGTLSNISGIPDVSWTKANMASSATDNIIVTKKPKYICMFGVAVSSSAYGFSGIYDVENNKGYRLGYWSSAFRDGDWTSTVNLYITSVTSSSVTVRNNFAIPMEISVAIYY